jgi:hypothetical protein
LGSRTDLLRSAIHLLFRAFDLEISKMSTSLWALVMTLGGGLIVVLSRLRSAFKSGGWKAVKKDLRLDTSIGALIVLALWTLLFLYCLIATIFADHTDLVAGVRDVGARLERTKTDDASRFLAETSRLRSEMERQEKDCAVKEGINQALQRQNGDQQGTINGCLSQAMKLLTPQPFQLNVLLLDNEFTETSLRRTRWIIVTNKIVTPVLMQVSCNRDIERTYVWIIGSGIRGGGEDRVTPRVFSINIVTPAWSPATPMLVSVWSKGDENIACIFHPINA